MQSAEIVRAALQAAGAIFTRWRGTGREAQEARTVTPEQCLEARELLGWSQVRLGAMSGTSAHFVTHYEKLGRATDAKGGLRAAEQLQAVLAALEAAGVEFTNGDAPGVRLRTGASDV